MSRELLARLAAHTPLLPGADVLAFIDIDSTQKRVYGPGKQGAGFGHTISALRHEFVAATRFDEED